MDVPINDDNPQGAKPLEGMHLVGLTFPTDLRDHASVQEVADTYPYLNNLAGQTTAKGTAGKVKDILSDTSDSARGDKALAEIDIATGKEFRLSNTSPNALTDPGKEPVRYMSYKTTLDHELSNNGTLKDQTFIDAGIADYIKHQNDQSNLLEVVPSAARPIADLVYNNDLAGAVTAYDQTVGAFLRRHANDPQLLTGFLNGLNGQLEQLKVSNALKEKMNSGDQ